MATEADHIALANKNHNALVHLLKDVEQFPEWVATIAFYKAVQVIEAVFEHKYGRCSHGHQKRFEALKTRGHKLLYRHLRYLWQASSIARYLYDTETNSPYRCFSDYMPSDSVKKRIVQRLYGIECEAVGYLSENAKKSLLRIKS